MRPLPNRARGCAGRVVSRICDAQEQDRLRACLACWALTVQNAQRTPAMWRDSASQQQQQQQQQRAMRKHVRQSQRRLGGSVHSRAVELRTAWRAWLLLVSERRPQRRLNLRTADLLSRKDQASLMRECVFAWNAVAAQRQAAHVQALQGRLERADAECCALRSRREGLHAETQRWRAEVEVAQARTDWAEAELLRRSGHEFARLRELQLEFSALQAQVQSPMVCSTCTNGQQRRRPWQRPRPQPRPRPRQLRHLRLWRRQRWWR